MEGEERFYVIQESGALAREVAKAFVVYAREQLVAQERFSLALASSSTALSIYRLFAEPPLKTAVAWERVHFFWTDERFAPPDAAFETTPHPNVEHARDAFLDRLGVPAENLHPMRTDLPSRESALLYERELSHFFGAQSPPVFDAVHLSLGAGGQIAALLPHAAVLRQRSHPVYAVYSDEDEMEHLTLTAQVINAAKRVEILADGGELAEMVQAVLAGTRDPLGIPAQLVHPQQGELVWWLGREAVSRLDPDFLASVTARGS